MSELSCFIPAKPVYGRQVVGKNQICIINTRNHEKEKRWLRRQSKGRKRGILMPSAFVRKGGGDSLPLPNACALFSSLTFLLCPLYMPVTQASKYKTGMQKLQTAGASLYFTGRRGISLLLGHFSCGFLGNRIKKCFS